MSDEQFAAKATETKFVIPAALEWGCDTLLQVGDFGYWEDSREGIHFLDVLSRALCRGPRRLHVYWVDGNHEQHDYLAMYVGSGARRLEPAPIREGITYLPRGCVLTLAGVRFLACGGAYSGPPNAEPGSRTASHNRVPHVSWFEQETITEKDVRTCCSRGKVDVLLSHDAPFLYPIQTHRDSERDPGTKRAADPDRPPLPAVARRPRTLACLLRPRGGGDARGLPRPQPAALQLRRPDPADPGDHDARPRCRQDDERARR